MVLTSFLAQPRGTLINGLSSRPIDNFGLAMIQNPVDTVIMGLSRLSGFRTSGGVELWHVQNVVVGRQWSNVVGNALIQGPFHVARMKLGSDSDGFQVDGMKEVS